MIEESAKGPGWTPLECVRGMTLPQLFAVFGKMPAYQEAALQHAYNVFDEERKAKGLPPINRGGTFAPAGTTMAEAKAMLGIKHEPKAR